MFKLILREQRFAHPRAARLGILALMCGIAPSCGAPNPKVHSLTNKPLTVPSTDMDPLQLTAKPSGKYALEGSITLWNSAGNHEDLAQILALSNADREMERAYKEVAMVTANINTTTNEVQKSKQHDSVVLLDEFYGKQSQKSDTSAGLLHSSDDWFHKNLKQGQTVPFTRFCDAILLKYASSGLVRDKLFSKRPTPLALCEAYFASARFFSDDSCADATTAEGKDYFPCFWGSSGVLNSSLEISDASGNRVTQAAFMQRVNDKSLRNWLASADLEVDIFGGSLDDLKITGFRGAELPNPWDLDPQAFVNGVTTSLSSLLTSSDPGLFWLNDRLHNFHLIVDKTKVPSLRQGDIKTLAKLVADVPQLAGAASPGDAKPSQATKDAEARLAALNERSTKLPMAKESDLMRDWYESRVKTAAVVYDTGVGLALWSAVDGNIEFDENFIRVKLQLDQVSVSEPAYGCFDRKQRLNVPCSVPGKNYLPLNVEWDETNAKLLLKFNYDAAQTKAWGLRHVEKLATSTSFHRLATEELVGVDVVMEIEPELYKGVFYLMSGTFTAGGHTGSITLSERVGQ